MAAIRLRRLLGIGAFCAGTGGDVPVSAATHTSLVREPVRSLELGGHTSELWLASLGTTPDIAPQDDSRSPSALNSVAEDRSSYERMLFAFAIPCETLCLRGSIGSVSSLGSVSLASSSGVLVGLQLDAVTRAITGTARAQDASGANVLSPHIFKRFSDAHWIDWDPAISLRPLSPLRVPTAPQTDMAAMLFLGWALAVVTLVAVAVRSASGATRKLRRRAARPFRHARFRPRYALNRKWMTSPSFTS